jgi:hypothetical protein
MSNPDSRGVKIFLQYWLLFAILAGFNFYMYIARGSKLFLVVAIVCVAVFIGWILFYLLYVRKGE